MTPAQIKKWRAAYPEIEVNENALANWTDCASLYGNDYVVYLEQKGNEAAPFIRSMLNELVWTYGNWQKAQRDGNPGKLLGDAFNAAQGGPSEYDLVRRFLLDYARANNIALAKVKQPGEGFDFESLPMGEVTDVV